jgi:hypothetical protein
MAYNTKTKQAFDSAVGYENTPFSDIIAIGTVVDTNDPMQLGRVRIVVPMWGDSWDHEIDAMPWCMYVTPFGGQTSVGARGPGLDQTEGGVAYGMWALPSVGAQAVVMSLDESHIHRLFMGCVYDMNTTHTLPHGRWIYDDHPELDKNKPASKPYGPYSSREKLIEPLSSNMQQAFGKTPGAHEWMTRAADYCATRVDVSQLSGSYSKVQDDLEVTHGNWVSTQGYQNSRTDPYGNNSGKNYDSHTYSWTTPGFHSISMDDRQENCRMRFRTTSGNQIILDDTNERIYISTAKGNNWIELDQDGNIDMFTTNKVSIRSVEDINLTSDKTIRMYAKEGIHMQSEKEIRMNAKEDISIVTSKNIQTKVGENYNIQISKEFNLSAEQDIRMYSDKSMHIKSKSNINIQSNSTVNLKVSNQVLISCSTFFVNGPSASSATKSKKSDDKPALFTNKVPAHEPYGRCMTKKDDGHTPEFSYDDSNMGHSERGREINRGLYWRR